VNAFYMLDTDISSYVIKGAAPAVDAYLRRLDPLRVCISAITRAELRLGVYRLPRAIRLAAEVERFLNVIRTLPWDEAAADIFARIRAGTPLDTMDAMIAAHANATGAILVTNNTKHFRPRKRPSRPKLEVALAHGRCLKA
jgi:tRNA(fMet)-specific endonuclease VapC